ncbi:hypothetical protein B2D07_02440 [Desulfococcus multivorans]|nr:hypothetical protein B2D07_02440 [Desulfococcus multivorans]
MALTPKWFRGYVRDGSYEAAEPLRCMRLLDEMLMVFKGRRILFQTISFVGKPKRFLKVSTNELLAFGEMTSKGDIPL